MIQGSILGPPVFCMEVQCQQWDKEVGHLAAQLDDENKVHFDEVVRLGDVQCLVDVVHGKHVDFDTDVDFDGGKEVDFVEIDEVDVDELVLDECLLDVVDDEVDEEQLEGSDYCVVSVVVVVVGTVS